MEHKRYILRVGEHKKVKAKDEGKHCEVHLSNPERNAVIHNAATVGRLYLYNPDSNDWFDTVGPGEEVTIRGRHGKPEESEDNDKGRNKKRGKSEEDDKGRNKKRGKSEEDDKGRHRKRGKSEEDGKGRRRKRRNSESDDCNNGPCRQRDESESDDCDKGRHRKRRNSESDDCDRGRCRKREGSESDDCERCDFLVRNNRVAYRCQPITLPLSPCIVSTSLVPYQDITIHYGSDVEPHIAVNPRDPKKAVFCYQYSRVSNSGALEIGIGYTNDGGKTIRNSLVPFQTCIGGIIQRSSDPWLSYSKCGSRVFLNVLVFNIIPVPGTEIQYGVVTSYSDNNGKTWSRPIYLITSPDTLTSPPGLPYDDKNTITADPNDERYVYSVWTRYPRFIFDFPHNHADNWFALSNNKGRTWFPAVLIYDGTKDLFDSGLSNGVSEYNWTFNNEIVVLPEDCDDKDKSEDKCKRGDRRKTGELLDFFVRTYAKAGTTTEFETDSFPFQFTANDIALIRSKDHGFSWTREAIVVTPFSINDQVFTGGYTYSTQLVIDAMGNVVQPNIGNITGGTGTRMRTGDNAPSYAVNPHNGNLYVAFQDSRAQSNLLPQIFLTASRDGGYKWSAPVLVSQTPLCSPNPQAFTPTVAVDDKGNVGILYSDFRNDCRRSPDFTLSDTWLAIFKEIDGDCPFFEGAGVEFVKECRLNPRSYIAQNGPTTDSGVMTNGDYAGLEGSKIGFHAVYTTTADGPFNPLTILDTNPEGFTLFLDNNVRTSVRLSVVRT